VMRGTFSHPELFDAGLLQTAKQQLLAEGTAFDREPATVLEMTIRHVSRAEAPPATEMIACIQHLAARGTVIVTDYPETYLLSRYLRRHTTAPVRFVLSVAAAAQIMHEAFYQDLPGTLLEGLARLLATNVKLYVSPMARETFRAAVGSLPDVPVTDSGSSIVALDELRPSAPGLHLFEYLRASGRLLPLERAS
jgi:hypothetical protein